ncbi:hypothetical protein B9T15_09995 [Wohlfahrtiimonas chitiniclastica]|nr:hypothetical protein B9T14_09965 [Wohlfahrtiimonas chitiniclastica]OYQ83415.1 hypothetical protein B9T15_09995 [Wohlfahrtiimonas chitiniclastica]
MNFDSRLMMTDDFSIRLKKEREKLKLSAEAFGAMAGVRKTTQYNYEKGDSKPDLEYLSYIAKMGCDIHYIITGQVHISELSDREKKLLHLFRNASPQIQAATLRTVDESMNNDDFIEE